MLARTVGVIAALSTMVLATPASAAWQAIRTSPGTSGWQAVVCDNANSGWRSCEMGLTVVLTANPTSIAATGETALITATVTDYGGNNVGAGTNLVWSTTSGAVSAGQTATDINGQTSVTLTSSNTIGGGTVTAATVTNEGQGSIFVPFTDKWAAIAPVYTGWTNYDAPYSCSGWTPTPSTVAAGSAFTQSQNCYQNQIAYRQDRQQSLVTGQVVNVGGPVPIYQTIVITQQQTAIGTLAPVTPPAPACEWRGQNNNNDLASRIGWTYLTNNGNWQLYDNGPTGIVLNGVYPVTADYNGYRYTVGAKTGTMTSGRNFEFDLYQMCKAPL